MIGLISFLAPLILGQAPAVPATEVSLLFAGDAMQHKAQIQSAKQGEAYDYSPCFADITHEIASADYAVVNLESPIGGQPYTGYPCFSAPDEFPIALQNAGFDLFLTANNHCLDRYTRGAIRTLHILDSIGADHIGTYDSKDSFERFYPFITSIKGIRIAFLNYTYGTNGFTPHSPLIVNYIDILFCLVILPLIIMLVPVEKWIIHHTYFMLTLIVYLYALYFTYRKANIPSLFLRHKFGQVHKLKQLS